ncbi:MAG: FTR1 family protein [Solirubrobacterales bacterium]
MDAFIVTLREGFEASLIIGIMLAFLVKTGQAATYARAVWMGVACAIVASVAIGAALFLSLGEVEGTAEALYEGLAMLMAAGVVTWMVFWMRRQARTIGGNLRAQVGEAIEAGSMFAIAAVAFVAVAREGLETALFLFAATGDSGAGVTIAGGLAGVAVAVALGVLFYHGAIRINLGTFFRVTGLLVIVFASYLLYGGVHELAKAGGGEALETFAPVAGLIYGIAFMRLFLRGASVTEPTPTPTPSVPANEPAAS